MMTSMTLRAATAADAGEMLNVIHAAFAEYQGWLIPESTGPNETLASVTRLIATEGSLIAEVDGRIVGSIFYAPGGDALYLHRLAVAPDFRRNGVGSALMARCEEIARERGFAWTSLKCRRPLAANRRYYERMGYRISAFHCHSGFTTSTSMIMRKRLGPGPLRPVIVEEYDPTWPAEYARAADEVRTLLGDALISIHHVGSTAVPGLAAKPTIDLLAVVTSGEAVDEHDPEMMSAGWLPRGDAGIEGRRFFRKGPDEKHTHHLHCFAPGHPEIEAHLAVVEYLRAHPVDVAEYASVKRAAAAAHPCDAPGYSHAKDAYVEAMVARAVAWAREVR